MSASPDQLVDVVGHYAESSSADISSAAIDELTNALSALAVALREEACRTALETSHLHQHLVTLLVQREEGDRILEQVGRVAANLGADNPTNLDHLHRAGYTRKVVQCLRLACDRPGAVQSLVASLLNAVVSDHEPTKDVLSEPDILRVLITLSEQYLCYTTTQNDREARARVALWLWRIFADLSEFRPANLAACLDGETISGFLFPLSAFGRSQDQDPNDTEDNFKDNLLSVLELCCNSIAAIFDPEQDVPPQSNSTTSSRLFMEQGDALSKLLVFAETATLPPNWVLCESSPEDDQADGDEAEGDMSRPSFERRLGKAKAAIIRVIIHVSWDIPYDPQAGFWKVMLDWVRMGSQRDDLISCGYLSLGNGAKNGEIAESLLRDPDSILPSLLRVLSPSTQVTTQHAAISLLRNIAIPPANKMILSDAGIIKLIVDMGVFADTRDMVETVQGGAAVVLKLLCQANASNAENFVMNDDAVTQVLSVIKRVDTPAVAFEASRIFANCIKSLTSDRAKHVESAARLSQADVISVYVDLLRRTTKYPLLTNDAIISLTLVTTFGPDGSASRVLRQLEEVRPTKEEELASGKEVLAKIVSTGPEEFSKEIRANTVTLLGQLNERAGGELLGGDAA